MVHLLGVIHVPIFQALQVTAAILGVCSRLLGQLDETMVHEYDPHYNLMMAEKIAQSGYSEFEEYYDPLSWYPLGY